MKKYTKLNIVLLSTLVVGCVNKNDNISIQGKEYEDRVNGIYDESITDKQVKSFLNELKLAVENNDIDALSRLVAYPCKLNHLGGVIYINNKIDLRNQYKNIITDQIRRLILDSSSEDLFSNFQGFMIGNGEIWFDPNSGITVFNANTVINP